MPQFLKSPIVRCWLFVIVCALAAGTVNAEPPSAAAASTPAADSASDTSLESTELAAGSDAITLDRKKEEDKAKTLGIVLLAGIAMLGVLLLAIVLVWGSRIRRLARNPLPVQCRGDELWYLRAKKELPNFDLKSAADVPPMADEDNA